MDIPPREPRLSPTHRAILFVLFWAVIIFGTSCTVVFTDTLYASVHALGFGAGFEKGFQQFWEGGGGLLIVKGWHITEYFVLFLAVNWTFRRGLKQPTMRSLVVAWLTAILYASTDEWHQTFVDGRGGSVLDVVIDSCGASLAWMLVTMRERKTQSAQQRGVLTASPEA